MNRKDAVTIDTQFQFLTAGWQCPECSGTQVNLYESRFGGPSEDRFDCQECGAQWGRE